MIAIIRISGQVDIKEPVRNTLQRLRLGKKYTCVVLPEKPELIGMVKAVEDYVAYGNINAETLKELVKIRGRTQQGKKIDAERAVKEIEAGEIKSIKPFFRLHPPRGGINTKQAFPKGVLRNHGDKINELIARML